MKIEKVVNNNMVISRTENGQEVILKGLGIGFQKKRGMKVDPEKIEKRFVLENADTGSRFEDLAGRIDPAILDASVDIISMIQDFMDEELSDLLYLTLTDHIANLIERVDQGIQFDNTLLWDIRRIYRKEYELGKKAVEMLNARFGMNLEHDEASFIALHIANAEMNLDMTETYKTTSLINDICDITEDELGLSLEEDDYFYNRFLMHLKFMFQNRSPVSRTEKNIPLLESLNQQYPKEAACTKKIADFIELCTQRTLSSAERLYLLVHIVQIAADSAEKQ